MIGWRCWKIYDEQEEDLLSPAVKLFKRLVENGMAPGPALFPLGIAEGYYSLAATWVSGPYAIAKDTPTACGTAGIYAHKEIGSLAEDWAVCGIRPLSMARNLAELAVLLADAQLMRTRPGYVWQRGLHTAVIGEVELAGHVIEHELGYRAERAMVRSLYLPATLTKAWPTLCAALEQRYQVPVQVFDVKSVHPICCPRHERRHERERQITGVTRYNHYWHTQLASELFTAFIEGGVRPHG